METKIKKNEKVIFLSELITKVQDKHEIPQIKVKEIIDDFLEEIIVSIKVADKVRLGGVGTLTKVFKESYEGTKPFSKENIIYPAKNLVKFKMAKNLKDKINE